MPTFSRQATCELANLDVEHFKTLMGREQLPRGTFYRPGEESRGWKRFTALDVFQLAVFRALIAQVRDSRGLTPDIAARIVNLNRGNLSTLFKASTQGVTAADDLWIGHTDLKNGTGRNIAGSLSQVAVALEKSNRPVASRVFLVNASSVMRELLERAASAKIDLFAD